MKIAIMGIAGKMGHALTESVFESDAKLSGGCVLKGDPAENQDIGELAGRSSIGIKTSSNADEVIQNADCIIDFTAPAATLEHLEKAVKYRKKMVIGTTGFSAEEKKVIAEASQQIPVVFSPNMSVGMNILFALVEKTASLLSDDYDAEVLEMHHRFKKDAPSGSALELGKRIAEGRKTLLEEKECYSYRDGPRKQGDIGFASLRGGDVVGDHTVIFSAMGERLELGHKASSRRSFSDGAVRAAFWLENKEKGLFSMKDVLGL